MQKEIFEQPESVVNTMRGRVNFTTETGVCVCVVCVCVYMHVGVYGSSCSYPVCVIHMYMMYCFSHSCAGRTKGPHLYYEKS